MGGSHAGFRGRGVPVGEHERVGELVEVADSYPGGYRRTLAVTISAAPRRAACVTCRLAEGNLTRVDGDVRPDFRSCAEGVPDTPGPSPDSIRLYIASTLQRQTMRGA